MSSVAVKNPETSSPGMLDRLHVGILAGVVYVLGSLAVLMELLPWLWWGPLGFTPPTPDKPAVGALVLLVLVGLVVAVGLVYLGLRLLGPQPTPGVKAGIFLALVTLLIIALITRWVSLYIEGWVYESGSLKEPAGIGLTVGLAVVLLGAAVWFIFLASSFEAKVVAFEGQGWFSTTSYKRSQGQRVRRGTIVGILALVFCGIYSMLSHHTLASSGNWGIGIPFTGKAEVRALNDARPLYKGKKRPTREVELTLNDRTPDGRKGDPLLGIPKDSREELDETGTATGLIVGAILPGFPADKEGKLREGDTITIVGGQAVSDVDKLRSVLEAARNRDEEKVSVTVVSGSEFPVSQAAFREINSDLKEHYLKITDKGSSELKQGQVVRKDEYEKVRKQIADSKEPGAKEPNFKVADPATVTVNYATIPVLPHVKYTLPIVIAALALWLAWRIVNVPGFADFLVATEAELNKVSWTSRRRLIQDTIVVLVTVVLFTVFLFVVDVAWGQILSLKAIGTLKLSDKEQQEKTRDQAW